ncbi:hypothetical protein [Lysinibacillus fusiformis]|uniref:hypothetical protein n=1 Tax=Lysinibacillus fusiformis TaxID=28031 RepID=UPI003D05EA2D
MKFTKEDLIYELEYNFKGSSKEQEINNNLSKYKFLKYVSEAELVESQFYKEILRLNEIIRFEKNTSFKIHKSYPSPRSLYPIKIMISIDKGLFLSKNNVSEFYELYFFENKNISIGDILLEFEDIYLDTYGSIKKSLLLLEAGHLLFNILYLANHFGKTYINNSDHDGLLHLSLKSETNNLNDGEMLSHFKQSYYLRNSGPYNYPLTRTKISYLLNHKPDNRFNFLNISSFFECSNLVEYICVDVYVNQGKGLFKSVKGANIIDYKSLNNLYSYINFWGVSLFTVFSIHIDAFMDDAKNFLLTLGYLSQSESISLSSLNRFSRPIKSFKIDTMEQLLKHHNNSFIPYYALITGE